MKFIEQLKNANINIHVTTSGAGADLINNLWGIPGASKFFAGASFPYREDESTNLLGFKREKAVCSDTAMDFAMHAYMQAYTWNGPNPVGIGITAAISTDRQRRGDDSVYVCLIDKNNCYNINLSLGTDKVVDDRQYREYQDKCITANTLKLIDDCLLSSGNILQSHNEEVFDRFFSHPYFDSSGIREQVNSGRPYALFPGSFNPPHEGHYGISQELSNRHNHDTIFHITASNPSGHKQKTLKVQELLERAKLLKGNSVLFTKDTPLYIHKARMHPETPIVMGADSFERMLDPRWSHERERLMCEFSSLGTRFFICTRNGLTVDDIFAKTGLDLKFRLMFTELDYKSNLSSTAIRNAS